MTVPTPTDEYTDLNSSPFTSQGGVAIADSQHAVDVAIDCDGVDDFVSSSELPFSASSGSVHSMAIWFKTDQNGSTTRAFMCQANSGNFTNAAFYFVFGSGPTEKIECGFLSNGLSGYVKSSTLDVLAAFADGQWHLIHVTVNGNSLDIYIDGVEVTYTEHSTVVGSGFTGIKSGTVNPLSVGAYNNAASTWQGTLAPPRFWEGTELTAAQVLEDFNNQFASVFVPTPDFEDNNMSDGWTVTPTVTYPPDQQGGLGAQSDGVTGFLSQTGIITDTDGQGHTYSAWIKSGDLTVASTQTSILNQRVDSSNAAFNTALRSGNGTIHGQIAFSNNRWANTDQIFYLSSTRYDDDDWYFMVFVADTVLQNGNNLENAMRAYVNSIRDTSGAVQKVGSGDQGPLGLADLRTLNLEGVIATSAFQMTRPKIWRTDVLSEAQIVKLYQNEMLAQRAEDDLVRGLVLLDSSGTFGIGFQQ